MDRDVQFFKLLTICEKILETIKWYCPKSIQLVIGKAILGSRDMNLFLIFQCYMFMFCSYSCVFYNSTVLWIKILKSNLLQGVGEENERNRAGHIGARPR